jgi:predicted small secreted protein
MSPVSFILGVGTAIAVAVPVHRSLRKSSQRVTAIALTAVVAVLAAAVVIAFVK